MTTIQIFALIGVFLIGAIVGGYAMYRFFRFALAHSTIVGLTVGNCANTECQAKHLTIETLNATQSLGVARTTLFVDAGIAEILDKAFAAAAPVDEEPPPS